MTYVVGALLPRVVMPVIEELYFRGFLLLWVHYAGRCAVPVRAFLFAAYHTWSP